MLGRAVVDRMRRSVRVLVRRWFTLVMVSIGAMLLASSPADAAIHRRAAALEGTAVVNATAACDPVIGRNRITWRIQNSRGTAPITRLTVTPAGSTLDNVADTTWSGANAVIAVQTVPIGTTSATVTVSIAWSIVIGQEPPDMTPLSGSLTFSARCGTSQPWATIVVQCDHTTLITVGNGASSLGTAELTVKEGGQTLAVYLLLPGEQRSLSRPPGHNYLEVFQYLTDRSGLNDFHVDDWRPTFAPGCGPGDGPIGVGTVPTNRGGNGGGVGGGGSELTTTEPAASPSESATGSSTPSTAQASARQVASPSGAALVTRTPTVALAAVGSSLAVAVLIGLLVLAWWVRRRRLADPESIPPQPTDAI